MNVSFGALDIRSQMSLKNKRQQMAENLTCDVLFAQNPYYYNSRGQSVDVVGLMEAAHDANFVITSKNNGNIELKVEKELPKSDTWGEGDVYVPFDATGKRRLKTEIVLANKEQGAVKKQVEAFVQKCWEYAFAPNCDKNEKIEDEAFERNFPSLSPEAEAYLEELRAEEEFEEEFPCGYN